MSIEEDIADIRNALTCRVDDNEVHEALAALDRLAAAVPRWRPIDEADRDDTDGLIVICSAGNIDIASYDDEQKEWAADGGYQVFPTHFQPLPQPPEVKA